MARVIIDESLKNKSKALALEAFDTPAFEPRFIPYLDDDPRGFVISLNLCRRHLTQEQKRDLIEAQLRETPEHSDNRIAKGLCVTDKTVTAMREKLESTLPIRLRHTPATCWVRPVAGIKLGIGRRLYITGDAEQREESVRAGRRPLESAWAQNVHSL